MRNLFIALCFSLLTVCCFHTPQPEIAVSQSAKERVRVLPEPNVIDYSLDKCSHLVDDTERKNCLMNGFDDFLDDSFILEISEKLE